MTRDFTELTAQLNENRKKVDVDHYDIPVREIIRMSMEGELLRAPAYQRKFRWKPADESRLIESIFLGLPVPSLFVATNPDATWELVDGLQRVSTLIHFIGTQEQIDQQHLDRSSPLKLSKLETLTAFNGITFEQLPSPHQIAFQRRALRVTALSDKADPDVRFDMFDRLNRGGIALTPQEVRACIFRGEFSELLRKLSENKKFKRLVKLEKLKETDGTREELVLKFFAYLHHRENFRGDLKAFLNDYMALASKKFNHVKGRRLFNKVMDYLDDVLGGKPLLRGIKGAHSTPLATFEAATVGIAEILLAGDTPSTPPPDWPNDPELVKHTTKGTNSRKAVAGRMGSIGDRLSTFIRNQNGLVTRKIA